LIEAYVEKQRIEEALKLAHDIQMSMLPKIFPPFPGRHEFDIFASIAPAKEVGGDFYDFFFISDDHLCLRSATSPVGSAGVVVHGRHKDPVSGDRRQRWHSR
jgi:hypothetical protein